MSTPCSAQRMLDMTNRCMRLLREAAYEDSLPGVDEEGITGPLLSAAVLMSACLLHAGVEGEGRKDLLPAIVYLQAQVQDIHSQLQQLAGPDNVK